MCFTIVRFQIFNCSSPNMPAGALTGTRPARAKTPAPGWAIRTPKKF